MGCDIHAWIEIDQFGDEKLYWPFASLHFSRDYTLFAYMAGVRNRDNVTPVAPTRGVPSTVSMTVKCDWEDWNGDAHDTSWLSLSEMEKVFEQYPAKELEAVMTMMRVFDSEGWKPRIVFWFDN